jgi:hypothetical protein
MEKSGNLEPHAALMAERLWYSTPDVIEVLQNTAEETGLNADDIFVLKVVREVMENMRQLPDAGVDKKISFELGKKEELVAAGAELSQDDNYSDVQGSIPEFIKGNATAKIQYFKEHDMMRLNIAVNFEDMAGHVNMPEDMPRSFDISIYGAYTDIFTQKLGIKNTLPHTSFLYFLHKQGGDMHHRFLTAYFAPSNLSPEAIEERLLHEAVVETQDAPLEFILKGRKTSFTSEGRRSDDNRLFRRKDLIYSLGKHKVFGFPGAARIYLTGSHEPDIEYPIE